MPGPDLLVILHLSDLHFGAQSRFEGLDGARLGHQLVDDIEAAREQQGIQGPLALVVVTGDVASFALPKEYKVARAFFEALVAGTRLGPERFVFCPGNHDVSWVECERVALDRRLEEFDDEEATRRVTAAKTKYYDDFVAKLYAARDQSLPPRLPGGGRIHTFPDLRISVAALNGCEKETDTTHGGLLSEEQAQAVMERWRQEDLGTWLKLVAIHHNPMPTVPADVRAWIDDLARKQEQGLLTKELLEHFASDAIGFEGKERLRRLGEGCRVPLILHGHHHSQGDQSWPWRAGGATYLLSAGSWGLKADKLPAGQPNGLRLLEVDRAEALLRGWTLVYDPRVGADGRVELGSWIVDPAEREGFERHLATARAPRGRRSPGSSTAVAASTPTPPSPTPLSPAGLTDQEQQALRKWLLERFGDLDMVGVGAGDVTFSMDEVYVPLTLSERRAGLDREGMGPRRAEQALRDCCGDVELAQCFPRAPSGEGLLFLGEPGSGKTTVLRKLLHQVLTRGGSSVGLSDDTLPVLLRLRNLSTELLAKPFPAFLAHELRPLSATLPGSHLAERLWARGDLLVLLDGLDEVAERGQRARVCRYVEREVARLAGRNIRWAVASRYSGYDGDEVCFRTPILHLDVRPLNDEQIAHLVTAWFRRARLALQRDETQHDRALQQAQQEADKLIEALKQPEYSSQQIKLLVSSPLLLTLLCVVVLRGRSIPRRRVDYYRQCLDVLLLHWSDAKQIQPQLPPEHSLAILRRLALALHDAERKYDLTPDEFAKLAAPTLRAAAKPGATPKTPSTVLDWLHRGAGVLAEYTPRRYGFMHLGLQEYLTAVEIARRGGALVRALAGKLADPWWQEVILLLLALNEYQVFPAFMKAVAQLPDLPEHLDFLRRCVDEAHEPTVEPFLPLLHRSWTEGFSTLFGGSATLNAKRVAVLKLFGSKPDATLVAACRRLATHSHKEVAALAAGVCEEADQPSAALPMGAAEEPAGVEPVSGRPFVERVTGMRFLWVPQGPSTAAFWLAETPVTNRQYGLYLEAARAREPMYWRDRRFSAPEQPVVGVSWEEAGAFCRWLSETRSMTFALPTEAQWEYAARGEDRREYPWGNEEPDKSRACFGLSWDTGRPAPVGSFPKGAGPFGHLDLAGNVWEWCEDLDHIDSDGDEWRALRGGCWLDPAWHLRSANRLGRPARSRIDFFGFRVCLPPRAR